MEAEFYDKIGQRIVPGSIIAYGHAMGRCAGIRIGKVIKTQWKDVEKYSYSPSCRITVHGIDDDWSSQPPKLALKKGTLMFPDRIIVLNPSTIPSAYQCLLDDIIIDEK